MNTNHRRLGKYELHECLGRGGMAEVWKAFDPHLRRFVAIKLLRADLQADSSFVARFEREAQLIASLQHPNIVQIYDFSVAQPPEVDRPTLYMVMKYVEGQTLASLIRGTSRTGNFPSPATILALFTPIALAIDYAHQRGMIHRDIKPANILLDGHNTAHQAIGEPILSDFGIAKLMGGAAGTGSGWWLGTPAYVAPEQVMGALGNERSDIYALGIILYEICTGALPFQGGTPTEIMMQHVNVPPPAPMLINPAIPPVLSAVILRALAKDPAARFPTASALVVALAEALNLPIPQGLLGPNGSLEVSSNPMQNSPLSPHLPSTASPPSAPLPRVPPPTPLPAASVSGPSLAEAVKSGPDALRSAGKTPPLSAFSHVSGQLTVSAAWQPGAGTSPPSLPARAQRRRWLLPAVIAALVLAVLGSGLSAFFLLPQNRGSNPPIIGHAFFQSSGQLNLDSSQGINDQLQVHLQQVPDPAPGNAYYGWLVNDQSLAPPISLGKLPAGYGTVDFFYKGDAAHTNLLENMSAFLITEDSASVPPVIPSVDKGTWRYYAAFSQKPNPADTKYHASLLDHLRHLLAEEPTLSSLHLHGGLDIWLFRNTEKVLEWVSAARDDWQNNAFDQMYSQCVRVLDYLDGSDYVGTEVPSGTPLLANQTYSNVGLLMLDRQRQKHIGYLYHIGLHLKSLSQMQDVTEDQKKLAIQIDKEINNVNLWLMQLHADAARLAMMNRQEWAQPSTLSLLNDMLTNAEHALVGRVDPLTGQVAGGVADIHRSIQFLATFDVQPYSS